MAETNAAPKPLREDRLMAALAYPFWFVVFPLVYLAPDKRREPFLRFHAYQGAALGLLGVVGLSVLRAVLSLVFRWFILFDVLLYPLLRCAEWVVLALALYGAVMAWLGRYGSIPFLSPAVSSLFEDSVAVESTENRDLHEVSEPD